MDIVTVEQERAFATKDTRENPAKAALILILRLEGCATPKKFAPTIARGLASATISRESVNAVTIERETTAPCRNALDSIAFVRIATMMGVFNVQMDSVYTRMPMMDISVSRVGALIHAVGIAIRTSVHLALICYCFPSIDRADVHKILLYQ